VVGQIRHTLMAGDVENEVWCFGDGSEQGQDRRGLIRTFRKSLSWHSTGVSVRLGMRLMSLRDSRILVHEPTVGVLLPLLLPTLWRRFVRRGNTLTIWWHCDIVGRGLIGRISRSLQDVFVKRAERVIVSSPNLVACCPQLSVVEPSALTVIEFGTADPRTSPPIRHSDQVKLQPMGLEEEQSWGPLPSKADACVLTPIPAPAQANQLRLAFIGRLVWYKGIEVLLEAVRLVPVHLTIVGDGPLGSLLDEGTAFGESTIEWLPNADDATCQQVLLSSDALVLASTSNAEAFGLVLIEAMAAGLPLITSDLPTGVSHINRDGETGLLFPVGDHKALAERISRLAKDPNLRKKLAQGARSSFEQTYSEEKFRAKILKEFR
jgi:glycosyltransferase involved in cell wall biosynthesis